LIVESPFDFLLLSVHNIAATTTRRITTPLTDATKGVTKTFFFFSCSLHWPDWQRYGFWSTLAWKPQKVYVLTLSKPYKSSIISIDTSTILLVPRYSVGQLLPKDKHRSTWEFEN